MMMNMKKNIILFAFLFIGVLTGYCQQSAYLFVYFTGNRMSEEAVRMAVSLDGYNYKALNGNQPVLDSRVISSTGGVRDPHILQMCIRDRCYSFRYCIFQSVRFLSTAIHPPSNRIF